VNDRVLITTAPLAGAVNLNQTSRAVPVKLHVGLGVVPELVAPALEKVCG